MSLRGCLEYCFNPNTVSKFIRVFPRFAAFFLILHIIIILYSSLAHPKHVDVEKPAGFMPKDPSHRKALLSGVSLSNNTNNKDKEANLNRKERNMNHEIERNNKS